MTLGESTPGGDDVVENQVLSGNLTAVGLASGQSTAREEDDDEAARILGIHRNTLTNIEVENPEET